MTRKQDAEEAKKYIEIVTPEKEQEDGLSVDLYEAQKAEFKQACRHIEANNPEFISVDSEYFDNGTLGISPLVIRGNKQWTRFVDAMEKNTEVKHVYIDVKHVTDDQFAAGLEKLLKANHSIDGLEIFNPIENEATAVLEAMIPQAKTLRELWLNKDVDINSIQKLVSAASLNRNLDLFIEPLHAIDQKQRKQLQRNAVDRFPRRIHIGREKIAPMPQKDLAPKIALTALLAGGAGMGFADLQHFLSRDSDAAHTATYNEFSTLRDGIQVRNGWVDIDKDSPVFPNIAAITLAPDSVSVEYKDGSLKTVKETASSYSLNILGKPGKPLDHFIPIKVVNPENKGHMQVLLQVGDHTGKDHAVRFDVSEAKGETTIYNNSQNDAHIDGLNDAQIVELSRIRAAQRAHNTDKAPTHPTIEQSVKIGNLTVNSGADSLTGFVIGNTLFPDVVGKGSGTLERLGF